MINYILIYNFATGSHLISIKDETPEDALISGLLSAMNSFANRVFNLFSKRIDLIVIDDYCIQEFVLIDDLDIDVIFIYNKDDHPFISELYQIIKDIVVQFRDLFLTETHEMDKLKVIKETIRDYLPYWKHTKIYQGISVKNLL